MTNEKKREIRKFDSLIDFLGIPLIIITPISTLILSIYVLKQKYGTVPQAMAIINIICITLLALIAIIAIIDPAAKKKIIQSVGEISEDIEDINKMTGEQFEKYVAERLNEAGWLDVKTTPKSGDHGVDIFAVKDGEKYVFQCKRYKQSVNTPAVQEIYTGKGVYKADYAVVITNSTYTKKAREMAKELDVKLWNLEMIDSLRNDSLIGQWMEEGRS